MNDIETKEYLECLTQRKFIKAEDLYQLILDKGTYTSSYKNVKYDRATAIRRLAEGLPMNCGDYAENIVAPVLRALTYPCNIWLVLIRCRDGKLWLHFLVTASGRRWTNKIIDGVAAAYGKKPFGQPACPVVQWKKNYGAHIQ